MHKRDVKLSWLSGPVLHMVALHRVVLSIITLGYKIDRSIYSLINGKDHNY